jgi:endoglucanase
MRGTRSSIALLPLLLSACSDEGATNGSTPDTGFVHVSNGRVVDGRERPSWLRGANFGSFSYSEPDPPLTHHDEKDYERAAEMNMNTVRLFVNHELIDGDDAPGEYKESGFAWIDQNVAWAREHGIRLILYATTVPGFFPGDCGNDEFWETPELQEQFIAMWRALAERYANETTILGYDLLAKPNPNQSLEQWQTLAERLTASIREMDPNHVVFVQRAVSIGCAFDLLADETFFRMDDPNVVYAFDRMQPWAYVAQELESSGLQEYGPYPDTTSKTWLHASWDSRPAAAELYLPEGDSDWQEEHFFYTVTDPKFVYASLVLQSDYNRGKVYFDDIVVNELDEDGTILQTRYFDLESTTNWSIYEADETGKRVGSGVLGTSSDAHSGSASLTLENTSSLANLINNTITFPVTLGHAFEVSGYMKGQNSDPNGASMIRLDFYGSKTSDEGFTKATLEAYFTDFVAWGRARGVPLAVSEFGAGRPAFSHGGLTWVRDMIDIMIENDLHFSYHAYHEDEWGIYSNADGLPDPDTVNQPLVNLFTEKLR